MRQPVMAWLLEKPPSRIVRLCIPGRLAKQVCVDAVHQPVIDFVADDDEVVLFGHLRDFQHRLALEHRAGRIVGIADQASPWSWA